MAAPPPRGLSLYDNLHDPNDPSPSATISSAPVTYKQGGSTAGDQAAKKPLNNAALQFQPIRRPQVKQPKAKTTFPKAIPRTAPAAASATAPAAAAGAAQSVPHQSTLADWAVTEEDEWMYGIGEKRQRGGRKKRKKRQEEFETNWDEMYDPTRPTNVDEFLKSDEKVEEVREWKALLYRHRKRHEESDLSDSEEETAPPPNQFAPPASYSFAPPPRSPPAAPAPEETADEAYARRLALSGQQHPPPPPPPPPPPQTSESQAPPPPPPPESGTISKAPIRYTQTSQPPTNSNNGADDDDAGYSPPPTFNQTDQDANNTPEDTDTQQQQRTNRPGQAGFAQRLMSKYGWTKGAALGANESGILNPLRVQVEKRRKRADADGGGWADPANKAKIIGGRRKDGEGASKFGPMSEVIVLRNMLDNMPDLEAEIADGLGQEIGEECGDKYGRVERLYIDVETRQVFIKFTDQVSALRAVNELDGRVFNGNNIIPKFYDTEQFEKGIYVDTTS